MNPLQIPLLERYNLHHLHPLYKSHELKSKAHKLPVLIGPQIPRQDRLDTRERYCRAILTLFHPWRKIEDLCNINQTWSDAFLERFDGITDNSKRKIDNIQQLHNCKNKRHNQLSEEIQTDIADLSIEDQMNRIRLNKELKEENEWDESFIAYLDSNILDNANNNHNRTLQQYILDANTAGGKALKFKFSESKIFFNMIQHSFNQSHNVKIYLFHNRFILISPNILFLIIPIIYPSFNIGILNRFN